MKRTLTILLPLCALAASAGYVQRLPGDVRDPRQNYPLRVARGEVVDLSVDFFDGGAPLDLSGAEVALHTRTNGMDAALSWVTRGAAATNSAVFVLDVDAVLPLASGQWTVVAVRGGRTLARLGGPAWVRGSAAGSVAADPVPALSGYATTGQVARAVADATDGLLRSEADPTVPAWAKSPTPPAIAESDPVFSAWADDPASAFAGAAASASYAESAAYAESATYADGAATAEVAAAADMALALDDNGVWRTYAEIEAAIGDAAAGVAPAAEAAVSRALGGTNAWLEAEASRLSLYAVASAAAGATTTNRVWDSDAALDPLRRRISALESRPRAENWADYAADGSDNPDGETVFLNRAAALMGSGFAWETYGAVSVLVQSGAVAFAAGTNGQVRIGLDAVSNYVAVVSGGSVVVGARAGRIWTEDSVVWIGYEYGGSGDYPAVEYCTSLAALEWQPANGAWTYAPGDGLAYFAFDAGGMSRCFFRARTTRAAENYFHSPIPAHLEGGVFGDRAAAPVRYDSTITIQSGGRTYRIPAQLVQ